MTDGSLSHRLATQADIPSLSAIMSAAITELQGGSRAEGFRCVELMAKRAGEPLCRSCGHEPIEALLDERGGAAVPLLSMGKSL